MAVHEDLGCLGFYGFGGGFVMARHMRPDSCCNECPMQELCWDLHKKRAAGFFPGAAEVFENMAKELQGPALMAKWFELAKNADPYTVVMSGNIEDGMSVANAGRVKDRGPFTLPYPFKSTT